MAGITINDLANLTTFDVHNNSLEGNIRFNDGNCKDLVYLDLSFKF